jgi:hypothetical protein
MKVKTKMGTHLTDIHIEDNKVKIGYHSFTNHEDALQEYKEWESVDDETLMAGDSKFQIWECVIPKGSYYYEGTFEDYKKCYASDSILIQKRI